MKNFRKFEQVDLVENLHPNYLLYQFFFSYFAAIFIMGKNENIPFLKPITRIKFFVHKYLRQMVLH